MTITMDIVVPTAGPEWLLQTTLPSVADATDAAGLARSNVILCDDGDEPNGRAAVARHHGFRYVYVGGANAAGARNLGSRAGSSPLILYVDDDVVLDRESLARAMAVMSSADAPTVLVGGLRPPEGSPRWLSSAYQAGTITPASGLAAAGPLPPVSLATGLVVIRRWAYERSGGFPEVPGLEDALFGLRLADVLGGQLRVCRDPCVSGVHMYEPTWQEWLARNERVGRRLRDVSTDLPAPALAELLRAHRLRGGARSVLKRALAYLPRNILLSARGKLPRRLATAAAEARGWRLEGQR